MVTPFVKGQKDGKQIWYNEDGSKSKSLSMKTANFTARGSRFCYENRLHGTGKLNGTKRRINPG